MEKALKNVEQAEHVLRDHQGWTDKYRVEAAKILAELAKARALIAISNTLTSLAERFDIRYK